MIDKFPEDLDHKEVVSPAGKRLFKVDNNSTPLDKVQSEIFHTL